MRKDKFHQWIEKEIETQAEALEKKAGENPELSSLSMPEASYDDLMKRIELREKEAAGTAPAPKVFHMRARTLLAVALAAVLLAGLGLGASGERLFAPKVESEIADGEYNVRVMSGEDIQYFEWTEEEAYEEIEERLGILALRLGYKPKGMELEKVSIGEDMGEAQMEFCYEDYILKIYENKQNGNGNFNTQFDGNIIDKVQMFQYDEEIDIIEIERKEAETYLATELEVGNAYYYVTSNLNRDIFTEIILGIFFKSM